MQRKRSICRHDTVYLTQHWLPISAINILFRAANLFDVRRVGVEDFDTQAAS